MHRFGNGENKERLIMKKLILISALLFSFNGWAEMYSCTITNVLKISKELNAGSKGVSKSAMRAKGTKVEIDSETCDFEGRRFHKPTEIEKADNSSFCYLTMKDELYGLSLNALVEKNSFSMTGGGVFYLGSCEKM